MDICESAVIQIGRRGQDVMFTFAKTFFKAVWWTVSDWFARQWAKVKKWFRIEREEWPW